MSELLHLTPNVAGVFAWIVVGLGIIMVATYWWGFWQGLKRRRRQ